jgi:outer membrane protein OmpA-like peptidoglycan-associated protein
VQIQPQLAGNSQRFVTCTQCEAPTPKTMAVRAPIVAQASLPPALAVPVKPIAAVETTPAPAAKTRDSIKTIVNFEFASDEITPQAREALRALAPALGEAKQVRVTGYTDSVGPMGPNQRLAQGRSLAVLRELRKHAPAGLIDLSSTSKALCCYVADNQHEQGRGQNRRVEVDIVFAEPSSTAEAAQAKKGRS